MANKPFVSARIPEKLLEQLEARSEATGETKTDILIEALTVYLNPSEAEDKNQTDLENRMRYFEHWISSRLSSLEERVNSLEELKELKEEIQLLYAAMQGELPVQALPAVSQKNPKRLMPTSSC